MGQGLPGDELVQHMLCLSNMPSQQDMTHICSQVSTAMTYINVRC